MPAAVAHVITALFLGELIRRSFFPKHSQFYVLVCGVAGLLPDFDIAIYFMLKLFFHSTLYYDQVHRSFTHTIFFPLIFLFAGLIALVWKKDKAFVFLYMVAVGTLIHVILDFIVSTRVLLFYPFLRDFNGLGLVPDNLLGRTIIMSIDAVLLISWLVYAYWRGYIKKFF